jgi:hypothetical protein
MKYYCESALVNCKHTTYIYVTELRDSWKCQSGFPRKQGWRQQCVSAGLGSATMGGRSEGRRGQDKEGGRGARGCE